MKKWCLCILMFGMLCMLAGCEQEEETREKSISKEDFGIKSTMSNEEKAAAALAMLGIDETSSASESNKAENQEAEKEEKEEKEKKEEPKPDKVDIYSEALEYLDDVLADSYLTDEYAYYKYKICDKEITSFETWAGYDIYTVQLVIEFSGVSQKYKVTIEIIPTYITLSKSWSYDFYNADVCRGSSIYRR